MDIATLRNSVEVLDEGLAHHDSFGAVPDESPVYIDHLNCMYELPSNDRQFNLGDLRNVLAYVRHLERTQA
jgi:hypothetical protein